MKSRLLDISNEPAICEVVSGFLWGAAASEEAMRANHPSLLPCGGLWPPIVWAGGVVRDAAIGVGMDKPTVFNICILSHKNYTRTPIAVQSDSSCSRSTSRGGIVERKIEPLLTNPIKEKAS
jgi:hypothetical protein